MEASIDNYRNEDHQVQCKREVVGELAPGNVIREPSAVRVCASASTRHAASHAVPVPSNSRHAPATFCARVVSSLLASSPIPTSNIPNASNVRVRNMLKVYRFKGPAEWMFLGPASRLGACLRLTCGLSVGLRRANAASSDY